MRTLDEVIEMHGVHHNYPNGRATLRGVSLKVHTGERVAIVGPNGAGKSTLIMVASGLIKPSKGKVRIFGVETFSEGFRRMRHRVGVVFQDPDDQLFCPTVWEDVIFGPRNVGLPEEEVSRRGKAALADVGLTGYEQREPYRLSVGEKKKAAIAAALALEPEVMLLDEPTANLEPAAKRELIGLLEKLRALRNITTIVSAHDVDIVPYIADRVYLLNDGQVLAEGSTAEVFSNFKLLESCRLEAPTVARLFKMLGEQVGVEPDSMPMTLEDGIKELKSLQSRPTGR